MFMGVANSDNKLYDEEMQVGAETGAGSWSTSHFMAQVRTMRVQLRSMCTFQLCSSLVPASCAVCPQTRGFLAGHRAGVPQAAPPIRLLRLPAWA